MIKIDHPGTLLKQDFLDDLNIKPGTFAKSINIDRSAIKNIIEGNRAITAEMSIRFGIYFNMSTGFWLNLQKDYDLRLAKQNNFAEFIKTIQPLQKA